MRNKSFPHFNDFVIIFRKDRATENGAETTTDAVEQDDDEDDYFVDVTCNDHEGPQEEGREEQNWDEVAVSTCNTSAVASRRALNPKKKAKSSNGMSDLVVKLAAFLHIKRLHKKSKE